MPCPGFHFWTFPDPTSPHYPPAAPPPVSSGFFPPSVCLSMAAIAILKAAGCHCLCPRPFSSATVSPPRGQNLSLTGGWQPGPAPGSATVSRTLHCLETNFQEPLIWPVGSQPRICRLTVSHKRHTWEAQSPSVHVLKQDGKGTAGPCCYHGQPRQQLPDLHTFPAPHTWETGQEGPWSGQNHRLKPPVRARPFTVTERWGLPLPLLSFLPI